MVDTASEIQPGRLGDGPAVACGTTGFETPGIFREPHAPRLVYGEIATEEVVEPGQFIRLWIIVRNDGEACAHDVLRLHVERADGVRLIGPDRSVGLTIPPGESRVAAFRLEMIDVASRGPSERTATASAGDYRLSVASSEFDHRCDARIRLAADWCGQMAEVA